MKKWMVKVYERQARDEADATDKAWICRRCNKALRVTAGLKGSGWGFLDHHSYGNPESASGRLYPLCSECEDSYRHWLWEPNVQVTLS
jgi:hypothetical protein